MSDLVRPSSLMPWPRTRAYSRACGARLASSALRTSSSEPQPSPRTKPLPSASKGRDVPVGESICAEVKPMNGDGPSMTLTPTTSARLVSRDSSDWQPRWKAVMAEEHAVSVVSDGPRRSHMNEMRLAMTASELPDMVCVVIASGSPKAMAMYSAMPAPTKTPVAERERLAGSTRASSIAS